MKVDLSRFRATFFQEAADHVNQMEAALLELEASPKDSELLNTIFRAAHSIKGGSGTFGFDNITHFTHTLESLLDRMRQGKTDCSAARVQLLLKAGDTLRALLAAADAGTPPPPEAEESALKIASALGDEGSVSPAEPPVHKQEIPAKGPHTYRIRFVPSPSIFREGMDPFLILRDLCGLGKSEVSVDETSLPTLSQLKPDVCYLAWNIRLVTDSPRSEIQDVFAFVEDDSQIEIHEEQAEKAEAAMTSPAALSGGGERQAPQASSSLRVATEKVDQLIDLVGELVIAESIAAELLNHFSPERIPELQTAMAEVVRNTRDLQHRVMSVRMLPVGSVFARLPRVVHDVAASSGKNVTLQWTGEETELDKSVLEGITDPLVHLVRNSADHGVELPAERLAAGKPESATIHLSARHESGNVVIEVADDGRGLDLARIRAKAVERGLVSANEELSCEQIQSFIFHPGFSTAEQLSEISGRGVGMDVVRKNVETLGGGITLKSVQGRGTTVTIRLPLTLAILEGQLVRVSEQTFVLPLVSVIESIQPAREHVCILAGEGEVVIVRQEPLPLLRLHKLFGIPTTVLEPWHGLIAVVEHEGRRLALLVDELLDQQQVVIKNLQSNFRKVEGAMGATILGDGRVALILDVSGLINLSRKNRTSPGIPCATALPTASRLSAALQ